MQIWEQILLGIIGLLAILFIYPGLRPMWEKSQAAPKDWPGLLLPIGFVVVFVLVLINIA